MVEKHASIQLVMESLEEKRVLSILLDIFCLFKKKIVRIFYLFFFILSTAKVLVQLSRKNVTLFYNSRITCQFTLRICICNSVETIVAIVK